MRCTVKRYLGPSLYPFETVRRRVPSILDLLQIYNKSKIESKNPQENVHKTTKVRPENVHKIIKVPPYFVHKLDFFLKIYYIFYMNREIIYKLIQWKENPAKQPLILTGARQVGKTWIMKEFGRQYFKQTAYISFDNNPNLAHLFENTVHPKDLLPFLSAEAGVPINEDTLLILDEIQEVPKALTALKYFYEEMPQLSVIAAGSTLGVSLHTGVSFPVGKVEFLSLYPMSFSEFLDAMSEQQLKQAITTKNYVLLNSFHEKLLRLLKEYMLVGGMPAVVSTFVKTKSFEQVRQVQDKILQSYEQDFSKYSSAEMATKLTLLWKSIPAQLSRDNKKFIYGAVKPGARARDFEVAIQWLMDSSLVYKLPRVSRPSLPLQSYEDFGVFKLFLFDIGLLCALSDVHPKIILEPTAIFQQFKGSLAEQFVYQELLSTGKRPFYWATENSQAEIDFILQQEDQIIPIEVKSGINLRAKSLKIYIEKFKPAYALRTSFATYKEADNIVDLPLYAVQSWFKAA